MTAEERNNLLADIAVTRAIAEQFTDEGSYRGPCLSRVADAAARLIHVLAVTESVDPQLKAAISRIKQWLNR